MQTVLKKVAVKQVPLRGKSPVFLDMSGIDMYAEDGELVTKVLLPEFKKEEIEVTATSEGLEISATRSGKNKIVDSKTYFMREGRQSYWRHLCLPREAKPEAMTRTFRNGRLKITMPIGPPLSEVDMEIAKRKETSHDLREITSKAKRTKAIGFRDQDFPNHWTRYRPVR